MHKTKKSSKVVSYTCFLYLSLFIYKLNYNGKNEGLSNWKWQNSELNFLDHGNSDFWDDDRHNCFNIKDLF